MLDYLFTAFVDNKTRLLDPTCGSGTSVISAMKAGAEEALGIEMDSEFASKAQSWLDEEWRKEEAKKSLNINLGLRSERKEMADIIVVTEFPGKTDLATGHL